MSQQGRAKQTIAFSTIDPIRPYKADIFQKNVRFREKFSTIAPKQPAETVQFRPQLVPARLQTVQRRLHLVRRPAPHPTQFSRFSKLLYPDFIDFLSRQHIFSHKIFFAKTYRKTPYRYIKISYTQPFPDTGGDGCVILLP